MQPSLYAVACPHAPIRKVVMKAQLHAAVQNALDALGWSDPGEIVIEAPKQREHGDFASSIALQLAKPLGRAPREVATELATQMESQGVPFLEACEIAGPGFINFRLQNAWLGEILPEILKSPGTFGHSDALAGQQSRIVNDAGAQLDIFSASLHARVHGTALPENGYVGEYLTDMADEARAEGLGDADVATPEHAAEMHSILTGSRLAIIPGGHGDYIGEITTSQDSILINATIHMINKFLNEPLTK